MTIDQANPGAATYAPSLPALEQTLRGLLGDKVHSLTIAREELTLVVAAPDYLAVMQTLRDAPQTRFEQMIDLCGLDYQDYGDGRCEGSRFAVVVHHGEHAAAQRKHAEAPVQARPVSFSLF